MINLLCEEEQGAVRKVHGFKLRFRSLPRSRQEERGGDEWGFEQRPTRLEGSSHQSRAGRRRPRRMAAVGVEQGRGATGSRGEPPPQSIRAPLDRGGEQPPVSSRKPGERRGGAEERRVRRGGGRRRTWICNGSWTEPRPARMRRRNESEPREWFPEGGDDLEGREEQGILRGRWRRFREEAGDLNVFTPRPSCTPNFRSFGARTKDEAGNLRITRAAPRHGKFSKD